MFAGVYILAHNKYFLSEILNLPRFLNTYKEAIKRLEKNPSKYIEKKGVFPVLFRQRIYNP